MTAFKYIAELEEFDLRNRIVIPCLNEDGYRTLLIKNSKEKIVPTTYSTKYLVIKKNMVLVSNEKEYYFHIITCKEKTDYMNNNFSIIQEYLFDKLSLPISDDEFTELLTSIEELFKKSTENLNNIQIGTVGELLTLLYLYENGVTDIFSKYHKINNSKHDIELDSMNKIEVKTTTKNNRTHRFSHSQLSNKLLNIYVASVQISVVETGFSLYDLFTKILGRTTDTDVKFNFRKLMNYNGVDLLNAGIRFNFDPDFSNVKLIKAKDIPRIEFHLPEGISNLTYDSICDLSPEVEVSEIKQIVSE